MTTGRTKYPRTFHLPWSPGATDDDKVHNLWDLDQMFGFGQRVIVTEKLDGENTTLYSDGYMHARSLDGRSHPSQTRVRALGAQVAVDLPAGWRVCGENMYAKHSLHYDRLTSFFYVFSIWDETNTCLSWDDTVEWCELLGLEHVPVLYEGVFNAVDIQGAWDDRRDAAGRVESAFGQEAEGYVMRLAGAFHYDKFTQSLAKYVRANHVTSDEHWRNQPLKPNELA